MRALLQAAAHREGRTAAVRGLGGEVAPGHELLESRQREEASLQGSGQAREQQRWRPMIPECGTRLPVCKLQDYYGRWREWLRRSEDDTGPTGERRSGLSGAAHREEGAAGRQAAFEGREVEDPHVAAEVVEAEHDAPARHVAGARALRKGQRLPACSDERLS